MKKYIFLFIIVFLITHCVLLPTIALKATKDGILTWFYQILPALLPFIIISGVFIRSGWIDSLPIQNPVFPIILTLFCGTLFGFPVGAKLSCDFYTRNHINKRQAGILCVCSNNFGPMYVNGYVIPLLFGKKDVSFSIICLLYGIPILIGIILLVYTGNSNMTHKKTASRFQLDMQIIDAGIISGFETLIKICGYIVLFSLITAFCMYYMGNLTLQGIFLLGNLEITNGIKILSDISISKSVKFLFAIQFLSFGGVSGFAQTASFLSAVHISIKKYLLGKMFLSVILVIISLILRLNLFL